MSDNNITDKQNNDYHKQVITCECGTSITRSNAPNHRKSKKHLFNMNLKKECETKNNISVLGIRVNTLDGDPIKNIEEKLNNLEKNVELILNKINENKN